MAESSVSSKPMSHLSIGEVLALLLEEFPDITISKIRFLESQGLIDPERTPSGYRKFYDDDVELLRCILREQRENYLPLRVIKDRLDSGEIDPTSEIPRPRGIRNLPDDDDALMIDPQSGLADEVSDPPGDETLTSVVSEPASDAGPSNHNGSEAQTSAPVAEPTIPPSAPTEPIPAVSGTGVMLTRKEVCSMAGIEPDALDSLESYGVVASIRGSGGMYDEDALDIARISRRFLDAGFDARHLRGWKVAADREAGLFEQMIQPLLRQRNPQSREQAREQLAEMDELGSHLRSALMRATMRHHYED